MIEKVRIIYGSEPDDFIEYDYDNTSATPLTHGRMIALDRDLKNMFVTPEECEITIMAAEPSDSLDDLNL